MKLNFQIQTIISVIVITLFNVMNTIFHNWIFTSVGFAFCGLMYLFHPVLPGNIPNTPKNLLWVRIGGVILILIGIFSRSYPY